MHPFLLVLLFASAEIQPLEGPWTGVAVHDRDSTAIGFTFARDDTGGLVARMWLPALNCEGTELGPVVARNGKLGVPYAAMPIRVSGDSLNGTVYGPLVGYAVKRGGVMPVLPPELAVKKGPAPRWTYRAAGPLWASPVVAGGVAYIGDAAGTFHAVEVATGKPRWTHAAGGAMYGTAAVTKTLVYVVADPGTLLALDRKTGREIWKVALGTAETPRVLPGKNAFEWDYLAAVPLVHGDALYAGAADSVFRALDPRTGRERWRFATHGKIRGGAAADDRRIYFGSLDGFVYALDRASGALAWKFDTGSPVTYGPLIANGRVVIGTRDRSTLFALDAGDGKPAWSSFWWMSWIESTPALVDGVLYVGSSDSQRVRALDPATGAARWVRHVGGWTWGTPLVSGDLVYYGTVGAAEYFVPQRASLGALDRATGVPVWKTDIELDPARYMTGYGASFAYDHGIVVAAGLDGALLGLPAGR